MTTQDNQPQKAPVQLLADILKDPNLTDEQKQKCETFLRVRFQNRRRMAWWSLVALLAVAAAKLFYGPARDVDVGWLTGLWLGSSATTTEPRLFAPGIEHRHSIRSRRNA